MAEHGNKLSTKRNNQNLNNSPWNEQEKYAF